MAGSSRWRQRTLLGLGFGLFAVLVYAISVFWLFPYPELARRVEAFLRAKGVEARIDDLGPGPFPGLKARRVTLGRREQPEWDIELSDARFRLPLARWIRGDRALEVEARTLGGQLGTLYGLGERRTVQAAWDGLDLGRLPLPPNASELPVVGRTSGTIDAELDPTKPERMTGRLEASIAGLRIGAGTVQGFPVPEVFLGDGTVRLSAQAGKVEVEAMEFEGGDLGIEFKGSVLLREELKRSLINGILSLQPTEKASDELGIYFSLFPGSKSSDGRYTGRVRGSLGAPRLLKR